VAPIIGLDRRPNLGVLPDWRRWIRTVIWELRAHATPSFIMPTAENEVDKVAIYCTEYHISRLIRSLADRPSLQ